MADTDRSPQPEQLDQLDQSAPRRHDRRTVLFGAGVTGGGLIGSALGYAAGWTTAPQAAAPGGPGGPEGSVDPAAGDPATAGEPGVEGAEPLRAGTDGWSDPGGESGRVAVSSPVGTDTVSFHGPRQAGIETPAQTHAVFLALDLRPGTTRDQIRRLLSLLTDDAARLTQGRATVADTEPELAAAPARMTVTFGFGPALVRTVTPRLAPEWLRPLPAFGIDRLKEEYSGGDLLLQLCGDDPMSLAHARRMLLKNSRAFTTLRWVQTGFRAARGSHPGGTTMRNLFGQVDGTANPAPESDRMERVVWGGGAGRLELTPWVPNGTSLVLRRIAMNLDTWDELDRPAKELVIGRRLDTGAPLTGHAEHDEADLTAVNGHGFPVISDISHLRRSRTEISDETMLRRAYNYDDGPVAAVGTGSGPAGDAGSAGDTGSAGADDDGRWPVSDSGLLFAAYQCDVDQQYVPVQRRLDTSDHLNLWTTPVGSSVFAIPPGCAEGGFIGDVLFA